MILPSHHCVTVYRECGVALSTQRYAHRVSSKFKMGCGSSHTVVSVQAPLSDTGFVDTPFSPLSDFTVSSESSVGGVVAREDSEMRRTSLETTSWFQVASEGSEGSFGPDTPNLLLYLSSPNGSAGSSSDESASLDMDAVACNSSSGCGSGDHLGTFGEVSHAFDKADELACSGFNLSFSHGPICVSTNPLRENHVV